MNNKTEFKFGDYAIIEQKRHGAPNEMFVHKVIDQLRSNTWVDVPVQSPATETIHDEMEDVCWCICCGVSETEVRKYRVRDMRRHSPVSAVTDEKKGSTITLQAVNELIKSLESAGELSIREQKFLKLAKEFRICSASLDTVIKTGNVLADQNSQLAAENAGLRNSSSHVLQRGEPPKTYRDEWFIARVKGHGFAVLRSLPEEYSYDYTTLDATYFRKDLILEWMQLPNSEFLPNIKTPATDAYLAGIKADGVEEFAESQKEYVRQHRNEMDQLLRAAYAGSAVDAERFAKQLREGAK